MDPELVSEGGQDHKLESITLLDDDADDVGPGCADEVIEFVCKRGMAGTLKLVEMNIERLRPWKDMVALFLSEPVETAPMDQFFGDVYKGDLICREDVRREFSEHVEELLRLMGVKAALEHAIAICNGEWGWRLRAEMST